MTRRGGYAWSGADYERERRKAERAAPPPVPPAPPPSAPPPIERKPARGAKVTVRAVPAPPALSPARKRKLDIDLSQVPSGMELRARSWKENSDA